jgi:hypothetical protein
LLDAFLNAISLSRLSVIKKKTAKTKMVVTPQNSTRLKVVGLLINSFIVRIQKTMLSQSSGCCTINVMKQDDFVTNSIVAEMRFKFCFCFFIEANHKLVTDFPFSPLFICFAAVPCQFYLYETPGGKKHSVTFSLHFITRFFQL